MSSTLSYKRSYGVNGIISIYDKYHALSELLEVLHDSKLEGAKAALSPSGIDWSMLCRLLPYITTG